MFGHQIMEAVDLFDYKNAQFYPNYLYIHKRFKQGFYIMIFSLLHYISDIFANYIDSDSDSDKVYSTKIYTSTISGLHEFLRNTNNTIVLIYK